MTEPKPPVCSSCGRERQAWDRDYYPMQVMTGQPCGWYSGDDGEICGACLDQMIYGQGGGS